MFKMSSLYANTWTQTTVPLCNRCRYDGVVQQPPLPQQTFFQLLHIMDLQTVDPLRKDTPDAVVHQIQIWQIGWPHLRLIYLFTPRCDHIFIWWFITWHYRAACRLNLFERKQVGAKVQG